MNWGRAKTILIIMFLVTDVVLLFVLMQTKLRASRIPEKTIQETVQILTSRQIQIKPEQISDKRMTSKNMLMTNFFKEPEVVAKKLLGQGAVTVFENPGHYEYQFESSQGTLHLRGEGISYVSKKEVVPYGAEGLPGGETISAMVLEALQKFGFEKATVSLENIYEQDGLYHVTVVPIHNGEKIYGINMHITADSEAIVTLEGHWFIAGEETENKEETLIDITTVLTELALRHEGDSMVISEIITAYYVPYEFLGSFEITAVPIYVIQDEAGGVHLFDAHTGEAIEQEGR